MKDGKLGLILVIIIGFCLLALFGILLPLTVGKVAKTYREHKSLAEVYSSKKDSHIKKALTDKKGASLVNENYSLSQERTKAVKEEVDQKVAQTPLPRSEGVTKEQRLQRVEKGPQPLKPSLPAVMDKEGKRVETPEAKTMPEDKVNTVEKALPGEKESSPGSLPALPEVAYVIPSVDKGPSQKETEKKDKLTEETYYIILPRMVDLKKDSKGVFPVGVKLPKKEGERLKPQISYWVGTGDASEFADMQAEDGDVWKYEIPDLGWSKHRAQFLFYMIRIVNSERDVIYEGKVEKELIDSFDT